MHHLRSRCGESATLRTGWHRLVRPRCKQDCRAARTGVMGVTKQRAGFNFCDPQIQNASRFEANSAFDAVACGTADVGPRLSASMVKHFNEFGLERSTEKRFTTYSASPAGFTHAS